MSWEVHEAEQYIRDIKALKKRYARETEQMLDNLESYKQLLAEYNNPLLMVEFSFVHRESAGCHAITQQPLRSAAQTRLYLYCCVKGRQLHLICAGDKASQARDNKYCVKYVETLRESLS